MNKRNPRSSKKDENIEELVNNGLSPTPQSAIFFFTQMTCSHGVAAKEEFTESNSFKPSVRKVVSLRLPSVNMHAAGMGHLRIFPEFRIFFFFTSVEKKNLSPAS